MALLFSNEWEDLQMIRKCFVMSWSIHLDTGPPIFVFDHPVGRKYYFSYLGTVSKSTSLMVSRNEKTITKVLYYSPQDISFRNPSIRKCCSEFGTDIGRITYTIYHPTIFWCSILFVILNSQKLIKNIS